MYAVPSRRVAHALYSFAVSGGAVSTIALPGDKIPAGAVITDVLLHVETVPTSAGGATISVGSEAAADLNGADAISGAPWSTLGAKRGDFTATTAPIKTTVERSISIAIGTAALTAGKFRVIVSYMLLPS